MSKRERYEQKEEGLIPQDGEHGALELNNTEGTIGLNVGKLLIRLTELSSIQKSAIDVFLRVTRST